MPASAYTNPLPSGTTNLSINVPTELADRIRAEAAERGVSLVDHVVSGLAVYYGVAGDGEAQKFTQDQMASRKPKAAGFWRSLLHLLHPDTFKA